MSSTELKAALVKLKKHSGGILSRFYPESLTLSDEITFTRKGLLNVRKHGERKVRSYTIPTFFIHHHLDKKESAEALRRLNDLLLLIRFEEGKLKARDIINCRNAEIRRYLLEEFGYPNFIKELKARVLDKDGEHELIMIPLRKDEEPITLVKVKDASIEKFYLLRVPPSMRSCKEAVAWTFGMTTDEYDPMHET